MLILTLGLVGAAVFFWVAYEMAVALPAEHTDLPSTAVPVAHVDTPRLAGLFSRKTTKPH